MKKIIFLFSLLHLLNVNAQSYRPTEKQNREIRQIEVEIGGGVVFGASKLNFDNAQNPGEWALGKYATIFCICL